MMSEEMDQSLRALEFPAMLGIAAGYAYSPLGAEAIANLRPLSDTEQIVRAQKPVNEIIGLLTRGEALPLSKISDCRAILDSIESLGGFVEAKDWLQVLNFLDAIDSAHSYFTARYESCPACSAMALELDALPDLRVLIHRTIDQDGEVKDNASPELARLRKEIRRAQNRMQRKMDELLGSLTKSGTLQGSYWTLRRGRNVLPVRATHKGRAKGLVHDTSDSGETLFIEPFDLVDSSNAMADLTSREHDEVRRILIELTDEARPHVYSLQHSLGILTDLDSAAGRARYAHRHGMIVPQFADGDSFSIRSAFHPLLLSAEGVEPTPVDLEYRENQRVLILTGPNTGGKTTTLKTLGLLCLMAQSSIPVPAHDGSSFPIFETFHADIGDEQNLAEGLSTFSGHLLSIQRVLDDAGPGALVLLDELGTATDPVQGGALSSVILERLAEAGATVLATTHLPDMKRWAHEYPQARNAATRFDEDEGRPTFQIIYDQPGASEAFKVARQLGFPGEIISEAESRMPEGEQAMLSIIRSLEEKEARLAGELAEAARMREETARETETARERSATLKEELRRHRQEELKERLKILDEARSDIERRVASVSDPKELQTARAELQSEQSELRDEALSLEQAAPDALGFEELSEGMDVYVTALRVVGNILRLNPNRKSATVDCRGTEIEMPAHQLSAAPEGESAPAMQLARTVIHAERSGQGAELNLHGERVEQALVKLERFLNRAVVDGYDSVRVLVGRGPLRDAVEENLERHNLAGGFHRGESERGDDATLYVAIGGDLGAPSPKSNDSSE